MRVEGEERKQKGKKDCDIKKPMSVGMYVRIEFWLIIIYVRILTIPNNKNKTTNHKQQLPYQIRHSPLLHSTPRPTIRNSPSPPHLYIYIYINKHIYTYIFYINIPFFCLSFFLLGLLITEYTLKKLFGFGSPPSPCLIPSHQYTHTHTQTHKLLIER